MKITKETISAICLLGVVGITAFATPSDGHQTAQQIATQSEASATDAIPTTPSQITRQDTFTGFRRNKTGKQYYQDGKLFKDTFFVYMHHLYHADADGYLTTGWFLDDRNSEWYFFNISGISQTGWVKDQDKWYYLDHGNYYTGWHEIVYAGANRWFYFGEDGAMYENTTTPDGYFVAEDGVYNPEMKILDEVEENVDAPEFQGDGFDWSGVTGTEKGTISGLNIAGMPAEFFMLSIAGETSGGKNAAALINGDRGRAYGLCQFDYRYDLVGFMRYAYAKHPGLWTGFEPYLNTYSGDASLISNAGIGKAFADAITVDAETAIQDQLEYVRIRYWDGFAQQMNAAGFNLSERHIAVSAAFLSVNVNCGAQANVFIQALSPTMSDEELIKGIYTIRNTTLANQRVGSVRKGTTTRYISAEPRMALELLYGYVTIDSEKNYGGGVEWHGNPFSAQILTAAVAGAYTEALFVDTVTEPQTEAAEATASEPEAAAAEPLQNDIEGAAETIAESQPQMSDGPGVYVPQPRNGYAESAGTVTPSEP